MREKRNSDVITKEVDILQSASKFVFFLMIDVYLN